MWAEFENLRLGLSVLVQGIGVFAVVASRLMAQRGNCGGTSNWLVLLCFAIVGTASACLMQACSASWLAFATTLPLMAVGATLDLKKHPRSAAF